MVYAAVIPGASVVHTTHQFGARLTRSEKYLRLLHTLAGSRICEDLSSPNTSGSQVSGEKLAMARYEDWASAPMWLSKCITLTWPQW